ncbi:MAG: hypothetical protein JXA15_00965 [Spirochaetales bacterium]|nr:hypothetical protein [Spirochaetales bacterium]
MAGFASLALLVSSLGSCALLPLLKHSNAPDPGSTLAEDKILIAGRIVLEPEPVQEFKRLIAAEHLYRRVFNCYLSDKPVERIRTFEDCARYFDGTWGELFVAEIPRSSFYWGTIEIPLKIHGGDYTMYAYLDSPWKIDYQDDDRFIYLGDFVYRFGKTGTSVTVIDGFEAARAELDGRYLERDGTPIRLVRRMPETMPPLNIEVIEVNYMTYYY